MSHPLPASQALEREFLDARAMILSLAASFDRIDRAEGKVTNPQPLAQLHDAISLLQTSDPNRAEQVQLLFSREYKTNWPDQLGVDIK